MECWGDDVPDGTITSLPKAALDNQFYGDKAGRGRDPFGHHWIIANRIREVTDSEMVAAFRAMFD